ncbi:MAG: bifunctional hydroxymethylpyrimidine kinase/phosphomethylpyrimidine kinase [Pseudomonadota bacterium]
MTTDAKTAKGRVLIIAGSDSGGAAGIQADIKAVTMLGGFAMTAITTVTAQNTLGVHGVWPLPTAAVEAQIRVTLSDLGADTIKTGLLVDTAMIERVAETLSETAPDLPRVIDPVMVATSGDRLLNVNAIEAYQSILIPGAALVTPNAIEAHILTQKDVADLDGQRRAAEALLEAGAKAALVKGGHVEGDILYDVLQTVDGEWIFEGERIETRSTHGTGCTLASAAATGLALGRSIDVAVEQGRDYLRGAILNAPDLGAGHGPVAHNWLLKDQQD